MGYMHACTLDLTMHAHMSGSDICLCCFVLQEEPTITIAGTDTYTLVMVDPDAPSPDHPKYRYTSSSVLFFLSDKLVAPSRLAFLGTSHDDAWCHNCICISCADSCGRFWTCSYMKIVRCCAGTSFTGWSSISQVWMRTVERW